jgi:DNA replication and repair protein RecF
MRINSIKLLNFRCYNNQTFVFSPKLNLIYGANACGKTSILEAIYYLSLTKSHRTRDDSTLIQTTKTNFFISTSISTDLLTNQFSVFYDNKHKIIKKNDTIYKKTSDFLGNVMTVLFSANDFSLIDSGPRERRDFLDRNICQISHFYLEAISNYRRLLKCRNTLLKSLRFQKKASNVTLLQTITTQLTQEAKKIIMVREKIIKKMNELIQPIHKKIASPNEFVEIKYVPYATVNIIDVMFQNNWQEDIDRGQTQVGPHKDDCLFLINQQPLMNYGSRGQQRNYLLSLKMALCQLLLEASKEQPILLLDDVFSELDKERQNRLMQYLNTNIQTIITAPSITDLDEQLIKQSNLIHLEKRK